MSVTTTRHVPYEVAYEGGFPSVAEFNGVWEAFADVDEFGLRRLFGRIASPLVESYEGDSAVEFTYADLGLLAERANSLIDIAEQALDTAKQLQELVRDVGEALRSGGKSDFAPRFDDTGREYVPSPAALERWGLVKAKGADDAR